MSENIKSEILKKRIGNIVSEYEGQLADLRIANFQLDDNNNSLQSDNSELRIKIQQLENEIRNNDIQEENSEPTNPTS